METAVFVARIFGVCYLILGASLLRNRRTFQQIMADFCNSAALLFFAGLLALVVGTVILLSHNVWVANWTVMITIIGWLGFIKGIWIIVFPETAVAFMQAYQKNQNLFMVRAIAVLILGAVMTFFGFFAG